MCSTLCAESSELETFCGKFAGQIRCAAAAHQKSVEPQSGCFIPPRRGVTPACLVCYVGLFCAVAVVASAASGVLFASRWAYDVRVLSKVAGVPWASGKMSRADCDDPAKRP